MKKYWLFAPGSNAKYWDEFYDLGIMGLGWDRIGDLNNFKNKDELENELQKYSKKNQDSSIKMNWDFKKNIQVGDIIISRKGRTEIIGYGIVTSDYYYDESRENHKKIRDIDWKKNGNWSLNKFTGMHTLIQIKDSTEINKLKQLLGIEYYKMENSPNPPTHHPLNTIFYGPPGTGKTYNTIKRAAEIIENKTIDDYQEALKIYRNNLHNQIEFITFHQNYSYEDFIQGIRPNVENTDNLSFKKQDGIFKVLADKAKENLKNSQESEEVLNKEARFNYALEAFIKEVQAHDTPFQLNKSVDIVDIDEDAFRYTGEKWKSAVNNGNRMKFSDLKAFYLNNITEREEIKNLTNISSLAKTHATYYLLAYSNLKSHLPIKKVAIKKEPLKNFVIIIDEINRANISRVFGELITLIEPNKRLGNTMEMEVILPSGDKFSVPKNLYIIGTMNTADKSIALLDIALRRRFTFEAMYPDTNLAEFDADILDKINKAIIERKGHDFQIGHAYFMGKENENLAHRMNNKVIPLLTEYFMNDTQEVKGILQKAGLQIVADSFPLCI